MKYFYTTLFFVFAFIFLVSLGFAPQASAQTCQWPREGIPMVYPACDPILTNSPTTDSSAPCTGNVYLDEVAAQDCAAKAEAQAKARGYTASCKVTVVTFPIDLITGRDHYLDTSCTINGSPGHAATLLAGYDDPSSIVIHINPGWDTLKRELGTSNSGSTGGNTGGSTGSTGSINTGSGSTPTPVVILPTKYAGNLTLQNSTNLINNFLGKIDSFCKTVSNSNLAPSVNSSLLQNSLCGNSNFKNLIKSSYDKQISDFENVLSATPGASVNTVSPGSSCGTATVNADRLNLRSSPVIANNLVRQLSRGEVIAISGSIIGETVEGSSQWWKVSGGNYLWAGGTIGACSSI